MKRNCYITLLSAIFFCLLMIEGHAQISEKVLPGPVVSNPWSDHQLIEPAILAATIKSGGKKPVILNIGAVEDIPGAIHIGAVSSAENMAKLQKWAAGASKNTAVIIYCGCCPFAKCPNIRPAFLELQKLGFAHIRVLDLPVNLKTNWIAKGYPVKGN